jgi:hypothetical protein
MGTVHDQLSVNNNHMNRNYILPIVLLDTVNFVFVYFENSDCQVNMNVSRILYKIHFPILPSTKTMSNESLSSQYIFERQFLLVYIVWIMNMQGSKPNIVVIVYYDGRAYIYEMTEEWRLI